MKKCPKCKLTYAHSWEKECIDCHTIYDGEECPDCGVMEISGFIKEDDNGF